MEVEPAEGWMAIGKMLLAILLSLPVAWDRERANRIAGLRTFPLVAMTSCAFMLIGIPVLGAEDSHARFMAGMITGLGFLGGGAIMQKDDKARGIATAASIWLTGALGMSIAYSSWEVAIMLSVMGYFILHFGTTVKSALQMEGADSKKQSPGCDDGEDPEKDRS